MTKCSIVAPTGSYQFLTPDGVEINTVDDLYVVATEQLVRVAGEMNTPYELVINKEKFQSTYEFEILLEFESETDAVVFKLHWGS